jgi:hypothetical protein
MKKTMAEIKNKHYLNELIWIGHNKDKEPDVRQYRITMMTLQYNKVIYGCVADDCPSLCCFVTEDEILEKVLKEADHAGD